MNEDKITHNLTHHRLYKTWNVMIQRCSNPKATRFDLYGGRGIKVCERWHSVENFIEDMYPSYQEGLSIDRIDGNGNYEPSNCRWTTKVIQSRNTRILKSTNTSGYRGVTSYNRKFVAKIGVNNKAIHLGYFNTALDAAKSYDKYVIDNNLEHTLNFKKEKL